MKARTYPRTNRITLVCYDASGRITDPEDMARMLARTGFVRSHDTSLAMGYLRCEHVADPGNDDPVDPNRVADIFGDD